MYVIVTQMFSIEVATDVKQQFPSDFRLTEHHPECHPRGIWRGKSKRTLADDNISGDPLCDICDRHHW